MILLAAEHDQDTLFTGENQLIVYSIRVNYMVIIINIIFITFLICLPPSEAGLPDTKWNSMSG